MYAVPLDITLSHFTQRYTVCMYTVPFNITLSHFTQRYTVCAYAVLFDITLSHFKQRYTVWYVHCAIRHCAKPFPNDSTLHRMFVHCTIRHYVEAFDATLQHKTRRRPHNGFVEWVCSTLSFSLVRDLLGNIAQFDFSYPRNSCSWQREGIVFPRSLFLPFNWDTHVA